jgi:uncharacterized protein
MKKLLLVTALLLTVSVMPSVAQMYSVSTVPNDKLKDRFDYTSNPDGLISAEAEDSLNAICKQIEDSTGAQVAVVLLTSIDEEDSHDFGAKLFNTWKLGASDAETGLLVLMIEDQRIIDFITGYGTETVLTDNLCYQIQQDNMVPHFKDGNMDRGMIEGLLRVQRELVANPPSPTNQPPSVVARKTGQANISDQDDSYQKHWYSITEYGFLNLYIWLNVLFLIMALLFILISFFLKDYYRRYQVLSTFTLGIFYIFIVVFIPIRMWVKKLQHSARNATRFSKKTGLMMHKLNEEEDNKYIEAGNVTEEKVKSIDYDVWVSGEPDDILILKYSTWFSKHSSCPKCKYKTYYKAYDKTLVSPTYTSSGRGERKYQCEHCNHTAITTYTIARLVKSSGSSSSGVWTSGSSGGGSRSSSGGSWGGGRSGGGGARSRW